MRALQAVAAVVAVLLLLVRRRCAVRGIKFQLFNGFGASTAPELLAGGARGAGERGARQSYRRDPRIHVDYDDIDQQPQDQH